MAVFEGQTRSLTPSFQNIQEALNQQANLELRRPQKADIATQIVKRFDEEFTKQRDFEKKLQAEGKSYFSAEMAQELSDEMGVPVEAYRRAVGRFYTPKEMEDLHNTILMETAQPELDKALTPKEKTVLNATGKEGRSQLAQRTFSEPKDKIGKQVPYADSTSSTGYRWGILGVNGIEPTVFEAPKPGAGGAAGAPKALPTSEKNKLEAFQTLRTQLQTINDTFDEGAVGMVEGRTAEAKSRVDAFANTRQSRFIKAVTSLRNEIIHARSGGAVTPSEAERLISELPDKNSSETDFRAKFQNTLSSFNEIMATRLASVQESNYLGVEPYSKALQPVEYTLDLPKSDRDARYNSLYGKKKAKSEEKVKEFATIEEAEKAGLKDGDKIMVGGKPATWRT